jgi:homoserine kinase
LRPVVFVPETQQLTSEARAVLPTELGASDVADQAARAGLVAGALAGLWPPIPAAAGDRLHEPPRLEVMGPSGGLIDELRGRGVHAWLSGAGPSVAAVVPSGDPDLVDGIAPGGWTRLDTRWDRAGAMSGLRTR